MSSRGLPGRQAQARRNDRLVFEAARTVLGSDPRASMADVGAAAGVGMSALYDRYGSKAGLFRALLDDVQQVYGRQIEVATERLAAGEDAWTVYREFFEALVDANIHALRPGLPQIARLLSAEADTWAQLTARNRALFESVASTGVLREGLDFVDIGVILETLGAVRGATLESSVALRRRMLQVVLGGLRSDQDPLTGPSPTPADYHAP